MKKIIKTSLAMTLGALMTTSAMAADYTLRAMFSSNESDEDYDGLIVFKDYLEARSNGKIKVEIFMGSQLCSKAEECMQGVADGTIDIYISTSGGAAGAFPYVQVLDLPYLMRDDRIVEEIMRDGPFVKTVRDMALKDSGGKIRLMTIGNTGGWRNFANTKRPLRSPADFPGIKMRTIPAELPQVLVKSLGGSPTPVGWSELFTSLQTGVVEGTKNGITDILGMKFDEAGIKHITLDGHAYMGALWWMNNDKFMSMPKDLRLLTVNAFSELQQATFASPKRKSIKAYQDFVKGGGQVYVPTPAQKAEFKAKAQPAYAWFQKNVKGGPAIFEALKKATAKAEKKIDAINQDAIN